MLRRQLHHLAKYEKLCIIDTPCDLFYIIASLYENSISRYDPCQPDLYNSLSLRAILQHIIPQFRGQYSSLRRTSLSKWLIGQGQRGCQDFLWAADSFRRQSERQYSGAIWLSIMLLKPTELTSRLNKIMAAPERRYTKFPGNLQNSILGKRAAEQEADPARSLSSKIPQISHTFPSTRALPPTLPIKVNLESNQYTPPSLHKKVYRS